MPIYYSEFSQFRLFNCKEYCLIIKIKLSMFAPTISLTEIPIN